MNKADNALQVSATGFFVAAGVVVVLIWGWFGVEQFTGLRLTRFLSIGNREPLPIYIPVAATILAPIVAAFFWRRALGIAENGVSGVGTVLSLGAKMSGLRNVELEYEFEGETYQIKTSLYAETADKLQPGDSLDIVIDKRKPTRVIVK